MRSAVQAEVTHDGWLVVGGERRWVTTFDGYLGASEGERTAAELGRVLEATDEPVRLVWDCRAMTGYDTAAREVWQGVLKQHRASIAEVVLITENRLVRTGAFFLATFARLPLHTVSTLAEV